MTVKAVFMGVCPNCGGDITDERLALGVPCEKCLPLPIDQVKRALENSRSPKEEVARLLQSYGTLKMYKEVAELESRFREFTEFFEKVTGSKPWSAQRAWARRILRGDSFAIIAPTGMGKTLFGMVMSLYLASKGKKCYIMLPTTLLVYQVSLRLLERVYGFHLLELVMCRHNLL